MTPEERKQARRAEQRRLEGLARRRAERSEWTRARDRAEARRREAIEQARERQAQQDARRDALERRLSRLRLKPRSETPGARASVPALQTLRRRSSSVPSLRGRGESVARRAGRDRDAQSRAARWKPLTAAASGARRAPTIERRLVPAADSAVRARRLQRAADRRAEQVDQTRRARRAAPWREHEATRAPTIARSDPRGPAKALASRRDPSLILRPPPPRFPPRRTSVRQQERSAQRVAARRAQVREVRRPTGPSAEPRKAARNKPQAALRREDRRLPPPGERSALARGISQGSAAALRPPAPTARRAISRASGGPLPGLAPSEERETEGLSWLGTAGNLVVDSAGEPVLLRGVNVTGLDTARVAPGGTLADSLALDDSALTILTGLWGINVVRVPFLAATMLDGTEALSAIALRAGLDELIASLAEAGAYVLLALQAPVADGMGVLPDADAHACWKSLATRYQDEPGVLFELYASAAPLPEGWPDAASRLIGTVRREHPAALVFVSGASGGSDVRDLPLRFATGEPVHDTVYTVRFAPEVAPPNHDPRFRFFTDAFPVVASPWTDGGSDLGRAADVAVQVFERYGIGWIASHWNAEPRLVQNATTRRYGATRFGNAVRRALALPVRSPLT